MKATENKPISGRSWEHLQICLVDFGIILGRPGPSRDRLGPSWSSWGRLGSMLAHLGAVTGDLWIALDYLGPPMDHVLIGHLGLNMGPKVRMLFESS